jgi:hypothetical protein
MLVLLLIIIKRSTNFFKKKKPNKNQHHKQNSNSLASGTNNSDMLLILKLSILGILELLEDFLFLRFSYPMFQTGSKPESDQTLNNETMYLFLL